MAFCLFVFTAHATAVDCGDTAASGEVEALRPTFPWFPIEPHDGSHAVEKCTASTPPMGSEGCSTERSDPKGPIRPASLSLGRVTWHSQRNYTIPSATESRTKPRPRPPHTPKPSPVTPQAAIVAIDIRACTLSYLKIPPKWRPFSSRRPIASARPCTRLTRTTARPQPRFLSLLASKVRQQP